MRKVCKCGKGFNDTTNNKRRKYCGVCTDKRRARITRYEKECVIIGCKGRFIDTSKGNSRRFCDYHKQKSRGSNLIAKDTHLYKEHIEAQAERRRVYREKWHKAQEGVKCLWCRRYTGGPVYCVGRNCEEVHAKVLKHKEDNADTNNEFRCMPSNHYTPQNVALSMAVN